LYSETSQIRLVFFACGNDNKMYENWFNSIAWSGWMSRTGANVSSNACAVCRDNIECNVFYIGSQQLYCINCNDNGNWQPEAVINTGPFLGNWCSPCAYSPNGLKIDVFAPSIFNTVTRVSWNNPIVNGYTGWTATTTAIYTSSKLFISNSLDVEEFVYFFNSSVPTLDRLVLSPPIPPGSLPIQVKCALNDLPTAIGVRASDLGIVMVPNGTVNGISYTAEIFYISNNPDGSVCIISSTYNYAIKYNGGNGQLMTLDPDWNGTANANNSWTLGGYQSNAPGFTSVRPIADSGQNWDAWGGGDSVGTEVHTNGWNGGLNQLWSLFPPTVTLKPIQ